MVQRLRLTALNPGPGVPRGRDSASQERRCVGDHLERTGQLSSRLAPTAGIAADGLDGRAGYVHRLAVRQSASGRGLGAVLLDEAALLARRRNRTLLRLDVDTGNAGLRRFYERLGFAHVRDVTGIPRTTTSGYRSASLYQRDA